MSRHGGIPVQTGGRVAEMRAEFDSAFSRSSVPSDTELTDVLALRIGDEPCLLRLSDIAEVIAHPVLTPVPSLAPALIGLTSGRGSPVGAYDLGSLLGRAPVEPRWLVLVAAEAGVGLLFEHFDGYHRIPLGPDGSRQLVEMSTLIEAITGLTHRRSQNQELES
jgi:chemotaxis signal transduction protein